MTKGYRYHKLREPLRKYMPTEDAYSSGHLVLSHFLTCMCSNVETNLSWAFLFPDFLSFEHPTVLLFRFFRSYSELMSKFGAISFQEYVSKRITHPVFYCYLVYKLRRIKGEANFISLGSKIVKGLRRRQYDQAIIERTIGLVFCPFTILYISFLTRCTLTNKAVGLYGGPCLKLLRGDRVLIPVPSGC